METEDSLRRHNGDSENETEGLLDEPCVNTQTNVNSPADRFNIVYLMFYLMGIASLLPWNFFSNAKLYFMYKLRNTSSTFENDSSSWTNETMYNANQVMFENYLALAALAPSFLFMFINVSVTKLISVKIRIITALLIIIVMFVLSIILTCIDTDTWQNNFLIISLASIVIMNAGSAVLQGAICGMAGMFPKRYMQAVMSGMGMGGLVAATANVLTIAVASSNPLMCGFSYFLTAECVIILALTAFYLVYRTDFVKYYLIDCKERRTPKIYTCSLPVDDDEDSLLVPPVPSIVNASSSHMCHLIIDILKRMWIEAVCVVLVFCVTLSCYPALGSAIQSTSKLSAQWSVVYFVPVTCFLLFNLTDLIGRTFTGCLHWSTSTTGRALLLILSGLRILFIPLFMFSNIQPRTHLPILFLSDWVPIVTMILFGLSNGYLATIAMIMGPKTVREEDLEVAGSMMGFFMSSGLGLGAITSIGLRHAV